MFDLSEDRIDYEVPKKPMSELMQEKDRQLDLQLYLLINSYETREIPVERFPDYMREPHYSTDAEAMLELIRKLVGKQITVAIYTIGDEFSVDLQNRDGKLFNATSYTMPRAVAKAVYALYTGCVWDDMWEG